MSPPYPGHTGMVLTSLADGVVHGPTERCAIQEPHDWSKCGECIHVPLSPLEEDELNLRREP